MAFPPSVEGIDYNGDGRQDRLAFYRYDAYQLALFGWAGSGSGMNAPVPLWQTPAGWEGNRVIPIGVTDYTGDGRSDVLAFYRYDNYELKRHGFAAASIPIRKDAGHGKALHIGGEGPGVAVGP